MRPEDFQHQFGVSDAVLERLKVYAALLQKWQKSINLVSNNTLDNAWERHFADSAQLVRFIPEGVKILADLGSGAGFPGLVIAMMRPEIEVQLIESDERKIQFLKTVSRETNTEIVSHNARIESVTKDIQLGFVTARALASLKELFDYVLPWAEASPALEMAFLKGRKWEAEIGEAQKSYDFAFEVFPSHTDEEGRIILARNLVKR